MGRSIGLLRESMSYGQKQDSAPQTASRRDNAAGAALPPPSVDVSGIRKEFLLSVASVASDGKAYWDSQRYYEAQGRPYQKLNESLVKLNEMFDNPLRYDAQQVKQIYQRAQQLDKDYWLMRNQPNRRTITMPLESVQAALFSLQQAELKRTEGVAEARVGKLRTELPEKWLAAHGEKHPTKAGEPQIYRINLGHTAVLVRLTGPGQAEYAEFTNKPPVWKPGSKVELTNMILQGEKKVLEGILRPVLAMPRLDGDAVTALEKSIVRREQSRQSYAKQNSGKDVLCDIAGAIRVDENLYSLRIGEMEIRFTQDLDRKRTGEWYWSFNDPRGYDWRPCSSPPFREKEAKDPKEPKPSLAPAELTFNATVKALAHANSGETFATEVSRAKAQGKVTEALALVHSRGVDILESMAGAKKSTEGGVTVYEVDRGVPRAKFRYNTDHWEWTDMDLDGGKWSPVKKNNYTDTPESPIPRSYQKMNRILRWLSALDEA